MIYPLTLFRKIKVKNMNNNKTKASMKRRLKLNMKNKSTNSKRLNSHKSIRINRKKGKKNLIEASVKKKNNLMSSKLPLMNYPLDPLKTRIHQE